MREEESVGERLKGREGLTVWYFHAVFKLGGNKFKLKSITL